MPVPLPFGSTFPFQSPFKWGIPFIVGYGGSPGPSPHGTKDQHTRQSSKRPYRLPSFLFLFGHREAWLVSSTSFTHDFYETLYVFLAVCNQFPPTFCFNCLSFCAEVGLFLSSYPTSSLFLVPLRHTQPFIVKSSKHQSKYKTTPCLLVAQAPHSPEEETEVWEGDSDTLAWRQCSWSEPGSSKRG